MSRAPRYRVVVIKTQEPYYESNSREDAIKTARDRNRRADDHVGVLHQGRYLPLVTSAR